MSMTDTNVVPLVDDQDSGPDLENEIIVRKEILDRINDSLDVEEDWRSKGQTIQQIYKGRLDARGSSSASNIRFNILNANTGVLLPSLFSKAPKADIRARAKMPMPPEQEASEILETMCNTFLDNTETYEQLKAAVKEVLLPGRGTCRVRWDPVIEELNGFDENGDPTVIFDKLLDMLYIEHVYWEDYTHEAVSNWEDCGWVAYRHLFTEKEFLEYFENSASVQAYLARGKLNEIFKWTDAAANSTKNQGDRRVYQPTDELQDKIMKALVWEYWDKSTREVVWICQDMEGHVVRIDPDPLELENFFPSPKPLLAVTTTDTLLPVPEYVIYQDLAAEIDGLSDRINAISKRIKVRGAYNGAQENLADILRAEDGVMKSVDGVDLDFDISKHVYIISNADNVQALQALYQARQESKQAMYEVTGISDIVRGQTRASETLGAQRIKSQFAALRIQDRKDAVENFCRDVIRIMCEIIAQHFDPQSFAYYLGWMPSDDAMMILRRDGLRISKIDVESDSTVVADEQAEIEAMSAMTQSLGMAMQQMIPLVQSGIMPMPIAVEFLKMLIKPFKNSRQVSMMLDQFVMQMQSMAPQAPPPGAPPPEGVPQ